MTAFQNRIKQLREKRNLTQEQAAERAGIPLRRYQRLEDGDSGAKLEVAIKVAQALDTTVDYLAGITDDDSPRPDERRLNLIERVALLLERNDRLAAIRLISEDEAASAPPNASAKRQQNQ
jgi:transcriptional regulator with XRE-family HTH domain